MRRDDPPARLSVRTDSVAASSWVRKAVLFVFAERTLRFLSILPLVWLSSFLWTHRQLRLEQLLSDHPLTLVLALGTSLAGMTSAGRARASIERHFSRPKEDARIILRRLPGKALETRDVTHLGDLLTREADRALGLESGAFFVRQPGADSFSCEGSALRSLGGTSQIVEGVLRSRGPADFAPDDPASPFHRLPESDRAWLEATGARLVVPLIGSDDQVLALQVLGEKRCGLPFDAEEKALLAAAGASAALTLERQLLRSSGPLSGDGTAESRTPEGGAGSPEADAGLLCRRCSRIYVRGSGALCPDDDARLEPAPVPHLLAGKYRFEKRIGGGGMGQVYRARDVSLSRDVAIKVLPRVSRQAVRRLRREARAAARLIHPNLGVIFAAETWRGMPMLVLEFLDGGTLEERIACGPVPVGDVVDWGICLAGALEAAHSRKILHRDIKPSNIGFTTGGAPKLMDFGVVRLLDDPSSGITDDEGFGPLSPAGLLGSAAGGSFTLTATGRIAGTAPYLSPEAVQGMPPGPDFDVWSLTLTLYEALTGMNPFAEGPVERALTLILTAPVPDPRLVRPDCPGPVAAFFGKALSSSFPERPSTAHELRERLELLRA
jgi:hypothetical protein